jgi:hypothetical protein
MDDIQEYSEESASEQYEIKEYISEKENKHYDMDIRDISFANNTLKQECIIPSCQMVFLPFNKLYKSPILQLKDKQRLILARKYKGANVKINDGKICDGKIFKF